MRGTDLKRYVCCTEGRTGPKRASESKNIYKHINNLIKSTFVLRIKKIESIRTERES